MKISARGCYAIQIMTDLALNEGEGFVALKDISRRRGIETLKYLEQVVALLQKAGLVRSMRGNNGGYKLVKPSSEYTLGEILRVTEGNLAPVQCLTERGQECPRSEN